MEDKAKEVYQKTLVLWGNKTEANDIFIGLQNGTILEGLAFELYVSIFGTHPNLDFTKLGTEPVKLGKYRIKIERLED